MLENGKLILMMWDQDNLAEIVRLRRIYCGIADILTKEMIDTMNDRQLSLLC